MIKFTLNEQAYTPVPTLFLKKYMCDAPSEYVKVYLYGLCLANSGETQSEVELEDELHLSSAQIQTALNYWCLKGFVKKIGTKYEFCLLSSVQTEEEPIKKKRAPLYENQNFNNILTTILKRELSGSDLNKIYDYTDVFGLPQDVVIALVEYCVAERGSRISIAYLDKVAEAWSEEGICTLNAAQQKIEEYKAVSGGANKIMRLMGLHGKFPGKTEMELYNKWTEKWGFTHEAIEYVMKDKEFSKEQPFKYLDAILRNLYEIGITTSRKINEHYTAQTKRRNGIKEVLAQLEYSRINITPKYEKFYSEWQAIGISHELILLACAQSVKMGSRKFESVDSLLREWQSMKLTDEEDVKKYLRKQNTLDRKIKQVYDCAGVQRSINDADRKSYLHFTQECGLPHEVILCAADNSSLASNPNTYMQAILKSWAQQGVNTLEKAKMQNLNRATQDHKKEFPAHEYTQEQKDQRKIDAYKEMEKIYGE
ncbi:MAG: DnaD domain protein [Christensenellaceae bacterium]